MRTSLALIERARVARDASIIDVGGGASTLVDDLLAAGYEALTVLDLSARAIALAGKRVGERGRHVRWLLTDIVDADLGQNTYDLWHDRATLHFLTPSERSGYASALRRALAPGGHVILATFALDGPERCSGIPVQRHDAHALQALLGSTFAIRESFAESHTTPLGSIQRFTYCRFEHIPGNN